MDSDPTSSGRVVFVTAGTRGEVQPLIAPGLELKRRGYEVVVATHGEFRPLVERYGLDFAGVAGGQEWVAEAQVDAEQDADKVMKVWREALAATIDEGFDDVMRATEGADAVVRTPIGFLGSVAAEKRGIPSVSATAYPMVHETTHFPSALFGRPPGDFVELPGLKTIVNFVEHRVGGQIIWQNTRDIVNGLRRKVGLPEASFFGSVTRGGRRRRYSWAGEEALSLCAWTPEILSGPDGLAPGNPVVTGYWFVDAPEDWTPPEDLVGFIEGGDTPICVSLGSMGAGEDARATELAIDAAEYVGERVVLIGVPEDTELPETVFGVTECPYDWLFERVKTVVHHGGAGTTGASLRAGLPSVVVPFLPDQSYWGWRLEKLGLSPTPIPRKNLTPENLTRSLRWTLDDPVARGRADVIGRRVRREKGAVEAADHIERVILEK